MNGKPRLAATKKFLRPFSQGGLLSIFGLYGLAFENFWHSLFNRKIEGDFVRYPMINRRKVGRVRSLRLRHLDCGSCNGCELILGRCNNPVYDIQQYNINFEASPLHAYALALTGPITRDLYPQAVQVLKTMPVEAVVAFGDCAVDGGMFNNYFPIQERPNELTEAIVWKIPGCPPTPEAALEGFFALDDAINQKLQSAGQQAEPGS